MKLVHAIIYKKSIFFFAFQNGMAMVSSSSLPHYSRDNTNQFSTMENLCNRPVNLVEWSWPQEKKMKCYRILESQSIHNEESAQIRQAYRRLNYVECAAIIIITYL